MKAALCLFGIVGGTEGKDGKGISLDPAIAYEGYKKYIIEPNDCDVFIHSWSVEHSDRLVELYDPKGWRIEPQVLFSEDPYTHRACSRWWSTKEVLGLVGEGYDMIMLGRLDCLWPRPVIFKDYDPEYFHVSHWNDVGQRNNHTNGFLDFWFFSCPEIMLKMGQLYDNIFDYNISQHIAAKEHLLTITDKINYTFYRGEDFEMVRRVLGAKE